MIKIALIVSSALLLLTLLAAFVLPARRTVRRERIVSASPAAISELLRSPRAFQRINPYKDTDPTLSIEFFGQPEGEGAGFRFDGAEGSGTQTIRTCSESEVVVDIDLGAMGQPVTTYQWEEVDGGTAVSWTTELRFGHNPLQRVFGIFADGMLGEVYERGLQNLDTALAGA